jgi:hypothetical protein
MVIRIFLLQHATSARDSVLKVTEPMSIVACRGILVLSAVFIVTTSRATLKSLSVCSLGEAGVPAHHFPRIVEISHVNEDEDLFCRVGNEVGDKLFELLDIVDIHSVCFATARLLAIQLSTSGTSTYALFGGQIALNEKRFLMVMLYFSSPCLVRIACRNST